MANLTRRLILQALPFIGASAALPAIAMEAEAATDFVAIPREAYDAIQTWAGAQRASVAASKAYCDRLRPIGLRMQAGGHKCTADEKAECDVLFTANVEAGEAVGPAREKMLMTLLRTTRGGAHV